MFGTNEDDMNGNVTEKAFGKMTATEKLWLLYNTMCSRDENQKKHFKMIYIAIGVIALSFVMHAGPESLALVLKIIG